MEMMGVGYLHKRRKQITMCEIRQQAGLVCARYNSQCHLNCFLANFHCRSISRLTRAQRLRRLHVIPVLIVTSSAATKSVNMASTWSNPANTFIISELGFVYFLGRTEARKAVMVYIVSLASYLVTIWILHREHAHPLEHFRF